MATLKAPYSPTVTGTLQEKCGGREKGKMFQTHIYDPELNCLSLCNSLSFLLQAGGEQSARSVILPSVSSYIHPSDLGLRFQGLRCRDSGPSLALRTPWKIGQSSGWVMGCYSYSLFLFWFAIFGETVQFPLADFCPHVCYNAVFFFSWRIFGSDCFTLWFVALVRIMKIVTLVYYCAPQKVSWANNERWSSHSLYTLNDQSKWANSMFRQE